MNIKTNYKKKHPGGRPSKLPSIDREQLKALYLDGKTDKYVAKFFKINESTLHRWKIRNKQFCKSLIDWKDAADEKIEKSLFDRAFGFDHPEEVIFQHQGKVVRAKTVKKYPPDPTSMIFWLKNRRPDKWRDKIEHTGNMKFDMFLSEVVAKSKEIND